jgi:CubicO group peptidase (beta-lactamase class C family)
MAASLQRIIWPRPSGCQAVSAGKKVNTLDQARIAELCRFIEQGEKVTGLPEVSLALLRGGRVIFADGFGVKELGGTEKPDGEHRFPSAPKVKNPE